MRPFRRRKRRTWQYVRIRQRPDQQGSGSGTYFARISGKGRRQMKTITVQVELTAAQLEYLNSFGYFMHATPAEILVAGTFGHIELQESSEDVGGEWLRDILNFVVEKRIPKSHPDHLHDRCDRGEFSESALMKRREKMDTPTAGITSE
jgi:hypothetical protein